MTQKGEMFHGTKANIVDCLEEEIHQSVSKPRVDTLVLDGPAILHMVRPGLSVTIEEYITTKLHPYILSQLNTVHRVDLVWDVYRPDSLKQGARLARGSGTELKVTPTTKIPSNWTGFLRVDKNKTELFAMISDSIVTMSIPTGKEVLSTIGPSVVGQPLQHNGMRELQCSHEEADTRMFVHVADMVHRGFCYIMVRTIDSDVVAIAVSVVQYLKPRGLKELWISYGTGASFKYIPVHLIANRLGDEISLGLLFFHSFTGCDTVSAFFGKGKTTAWETWQNYPEVTFAFQQLSGSPPGESVIPDYIMELIEIFVCRMYKFSEKSVDEARLEGFYFKGLDFDHLPPSSDALKQHVLRAVYQSGHIWGNPC